MGYGSIKCNSIVFKNVSDVTGLQQNLISISQLCDIGYKVLFNKRERMVFDQKTAIVLTTNREKDIYVLDMFFADNSIFCCFFSRAQSHVIWIWRKRLSHTNFNNISKIVGN